MSIATNMALVLLSIGLLLGAIFLVRLAAGVWQIGPELQRKIVHVATGLYALTIPLTFEDRWPVVMLVALSLVVMGVLRLPALRRSGMGSALHSVERKSHGEIYLALAVGFMFLRSSHEPVLFVLPVLVLTLSDAAAALVGTAYGRKRFPIEDGYKSIEGVIVFFTVTLLTSMIALLLLTDISRPGVIVLSTIVAAFASLVEADSWRGLDNLFVPLGVHLMLEAHLNSPLGTLLVLVVFFAIALAVIILAAPALGISLHAARATLVLVFLVYVVSGLNNTLMVAIAAATHLAARRNHPDRGKHPDLDFLAMSAAASIFWLWFGEFFDKSAINLFNLTFAGVAAGLCVIACGNSRWLSVTASIAIGLAVWAIMQANPPAAHWHGDMRIWIAVSLAAAMAGPLLRPQSYTRYRYPQIFLGAMIAPLFIYVTKAIWS